jgi:hypothetical protein
VGLQRRVARGGDCGQVEEHPPEGGVVLGVGVGKAVAQVLVQEAVAEPGERAPLVAEDVQRDAPTPVQLADDPVRGHEHVVEGDLGQLVGAVGLHDGADVDARVAHVDDEGRQAAVPRLGCPGAGEEQAPRRVSRPARPDLAPVDDVAALDGAGRCPETGEVGAGARFREALAPELAAGEELGEGVGDERCGPHGREDRRQDLEVLEQRHAGHPVAGEGVPQLRPVHDRAAEPAELLRPAVAGPALLEERLHQRGHGPHPLLERGDRPGDGAQGGWLLGQPHLEGAGVAAHVEMRVGHRRRPDR